MLKLSVVVAAFNEENIISANMLRIVAELNSRPETDWEIICVNDGSTDRTGDLLNDIAKRDSKIHTIHHRRNFGQGRALRTAFDVCQGDVIVTLDADLSYGPEYIYRLADKLVESNAEIALASPYTKGGQVKNVPFHRHILSKWGNRYLAKMSNYQISTSTCVVRAYRREVLDNVVLTSDGMELQLELLMKAFMMGFLVCEVPAKLEWADDKAAHSGLRRASKMRLLRTIRLYLLMGWLQRPAFIFMILSWLMIIPGVYIVITFILISIRILKEKMALGLFQALHLTLKELVDNYYQNIIFCAALLVFGISCFAFSMLFIQNKLYFEELLLLGQKNFVRGRSSTNSKK